MRLVTPSGLQASDFLVDTTYLGITLTLSKMSLDYLSNHLVNQIINPKTKNLTVLNDEAFNYSKTMRKLLQPRPYA